MGRIAGLPAHRPRAGSGLAHVAVRCATFCCFPGSAARPAPAPVDPQVCAPRAGLGRSAQPRPHALRPHLRAGGARRARVSQLQRCGQSHRARPADGQGAVGVLHRRPGAVRTGGLAGQGFVHQRRRPALLCERGGRATAVEVPRRSLGAESPRQPAGHLRVAGARRPGGAGRARVFRGEHLAVHGHVHLRARSRHGPRPLGQ